MQGSYMAKQPVLVDEHLPTVVALISGDFTAFQF